MLKEMMVNSVIQHIEDNLENYFITIENLVTYSGYSRRYLQLTFKQSMGIPVGKYIRLRRASRAAALLKLTKLSILDISERLLYDSQQTFAREFRKIIGCTPMQYRNEACWQLEKLLGRKYVNETYLTPVLCHLDKKKVFGKIFDHKELILYTGVDIKTRWGRMHPHINRHEKITVSNRIPFNNKGDITARTVLWTDEKASNCCITIEGGMYAHFSFQCRMDEYMDFMYKIYYNSLPMHNLNKRDAYDIEHISVSNLASDTILTCDIYLPVYEADNLNF
ncbi:helix-turn-helix domain-containing protein [Escherichia coli]|nr:helix-turn-helix domain-containing protein [Escherichia coli]EFH3940196.1 helix-turn-helix domain-containing protein [Escherichia coli]EFH8504644.1 AraC family transcriptional regulator [Escherichia coli]EGY1236150.1 helix-turn-helix domain-containing protein [Escherichia coli]EIL3305882.1 helix-turn-helix domain-containing protein [Escherichia coli]